MRRFPHSWDKTLHTLGFRRTTTRKQTRRGRQAKLEGLERRELLTGTPNDPLPEYVLADWAADDTPGQFLVSTEYDAQGAATAVLAIDPTVTEVDTSPQELVLELRDGEQVLQRQEIYVDFIDDQFRHAFYQDRLETAAQKVAEPTETEVNTWLAALNEQGDFTDTTDTVEEAERLTGIARLQFDAEDEVDTFDLEEAERQRVYAGLTHTAGEITGLLDAATTPEELLAAQTLLASVGDTALLLGDRLHADAALATSDLTAAAEAARAAAFDASSSYYTLLSGFQRNQELTRTEDGSSAYILGFVEEGTYSATASLRFEFGDFDAGVQALIYDPGTSGGGASASSVDVSFPALKDATLDEANPLVSDNGVELTVSDGASANDRKAALLGFDLSQQQEAHVGSVPTSAVLDLHQLSGAGAGLQNELRAHNQPWATVAGVDDWSEASADWTNNYPSGGQSAVLDTWSVETTGLKTVDVKEAVQRGLLFGDANLDGVIDAGGASGDVEAFHQAVTDWAGYNARYGGEVLTAANVPIEYRGDADWDGVVDASDAPEFLARVGVVAGDFNFDGVVDMHDFTILEDKYTAVSPGYIDGDADFSGKVTDLDYDLWSMKASEQNPPVPEVASPWLTLVAQTPDGQAVSDTRYASRDHTDPSLHPKLRVTFDTQVNVTKFWGDGQDLKVDYEFRYEGASPDATFDVYTVDAAGNRSTSPIATQVVTSVGAGSQTLTLNSIAGSQALIDASTLAVEITSGAAQSQSRRLDYGLFEDTSGDWHAFGTRGDDTLAVATNGITLTTVGGDVASVAAASLGTALQLYAHLGDGNDTFNTGEEIPNVVENYHVDGGLGDDEYRLLIVNEVVPQMTVSIADSGGIDSLHTWGPASGQLELNSTATQELLGLGGNLDARFTSAAIIDVVSFSVQPSTVGRGHGGAPIVVDSLGDVVDKHFDAGGLTLREALLLADAIHGPNTIEFDSTLFGDAQQTITLTDQDGDGDRDELRLDGDVTIIGPGADLLAISGGDDTRVFNVLDGATATVEDLTVTEGYVLGNGAAFFNDGDLTLRGVTVSNNEAVSDGTSESGSGAGVYSLNNTLTVIDSTFSGNDADGYGGGIKFKRNLSSSTAILTVSGSTFYENTSDNRGSAINLTAFSGSGEHLIANTTIYDNQAKWGSALYMDGFSSLQARVVNSTIVDNHTTNNGHIGGLWLVSRGNARVEVENSILVGNTRGSNADASDLRNSRVGSHSGLIAIANDMYVSASGPIEGLPASSSNSIDLANASQALLAPFGDYGGSTKTIALLPGSPAIDAGDGTLALDENGQALLTDQRGFDRVVDGDLSGTPTVNIGAAELTANAVQRRQDGTLVVSGDLQSNQIFAAPSEVTIDGVTTLVDVAGASGLILRGFAGADGLALSPTVSLGATAYGGDGTDTLSGGGGDDSLYGGDGNDYLDGRGGSDELHGDSGDDNYLSDVNDVALPPEIQLPSNLTSASIWGTAGRVFVEDPQSAWSISDSTSGSGSSPSITLKSGPNIGGASYGMVGGAFYFVPGVDTEVGSYTFTARFGHSNGVDEHFADFTVNHEGYNPDTPRFSGGTAATYIVQSGYLAQDTIEDVVQFGVDDNEYSDSEDIVYGGALDSNGVLRFDPDDYAGQRKKFTLSITDDGANGGTTRTDSADFYAHVETDYYVPGSPSPTGDPVQHFVGYYSPGLAIDFARSTGLFEQGDPPLHIPLQEYSGALLQWTAVYYSPNLSGDPAHNPRLTNVSSSQGGSVTFDAEAFTIDYTPPSPDFEGLDQISYSFTHPGDVSAGPDEQWGTSDDTVSMVESNTGTIYVSVGSTVTAKLNPSGSNPEHAFLPVNSDDDNENGVADSEERIGPIEGEDDLVTTVGVEVEFTRGDLVQSDYRASFSLSVGQSWDVRLWADAEKSEEVFATVTDSNGDILAVGKDYAIDELPTTLYIEGIGAQDTDQLGISVSATDNPFHGIVGSPDVDIASSTGATDTVGLTAVSAGLSITNYVPLDSVVDLTASAITPQSVEGELQLTVEGSSVELYEDVFLTTPVSGETWPGEEGRSWFVKGTEIGETTFTLKWTSDEGDTFVVDRKTVEVVSVDLRISHGQGGAELDDGIGDGKEEYDPLAKQGGAFTVANLNDTDADGRVDNADSNGVTTWSSNVVGGDPTSGDTTVTVQDSSGFSAGDYVTVSSALEATGTGRFPRERRQISAITGNTITFGAPLSLDGYALTSVTHGGEDEIDLMKLRIMPPKGGKPSDIVELEVVGGDVALWEESTRETEVEPVEGKFSFTKGDIGDGMTLWVEARTASTSVGDIAIRASFLSAVDTVNATGIWMTASKVLHDAADPPWVGVPDPPQGAATAFGGWGIRPPYVTTDGTVTRLHHVIGFEFSVTPQGLQDQSPVHIDMARRIEKVAWTKDDADGVWVLTEDDNVISELSEQFPVLEDAANDDGKQGDGVVDESSEPDANNLMYQLDAPGYGTQVNIGGEWVPTPQYSDYHGIAARWNFLEYARVSFDEPVEYNGLHGSRASGFVPWHSAITLERDDDGELQRTTGDAAETDANNIGPGLIDLPNTP